MHTWAPSRASPCHFHLLPVAAVALVPCSFHPLHGRTRPESRSPSPERHSKEQPFTVHFRFLYSQKVVQYYVNMLLIDSVGKYKYLVVIYNIHWDVHLVCLKAQTLLSPSSSSSDEKVILTARTVG
jgi:hypothetical protein